MLQSLVSVASPTHPVPPCAAVVASVLVRVCVPVPQSAEQSVHSPNASHSQSTNSNNIWYLIIFLLLITKISARIPIYFDITRIHLSTWAMLCVAISGLSRIPNTSSTSMFCSRCFCSCTCLCTSTTIGRAISPFTKRIPFTVD